MMLSKSDWKPIKNYPDYEISSNGLVRNSKGKLLKLTKTDLGYFRVGLTKNKKQKTFNIGRLVLEAFIGPPPKDFHAAHLNGNPGDNRVENLKWCSVKENHSHKKLHGTWQIGEKGGTAKITDAQARDIKARYKRFKPRLDNSRELAAEFGVGHNTIKNIAYRNKRIGM